MRVLGQNLVVKVDGNKCTIEIDLSKELGASKSGKSILVATSKGNIEIADGLMLGLNCYKQIKGV